MTDLEVCRLSAEALGKKGVREFNGKIVFDSDDVPVVDGWNPLIDAEQRWECVVFLLKDGGTVILNDGDGHEWFKGVAETLQVVTRYCPASEFPARAVAAEQRLKEAEKDAQRYRYIRQGLPGTYGSILIYAGAALDQAIDAEVLGENGNALPEQMQQALSRSAGRRAND